MTITAPAAAPTNDPLAADNQAPIAMAWITMAHRLRQPGQAALAGIVAAKGVRAAIDNLDWGGASKTLTTRSQSLLGPYTNGIHQAAGALGLTAPHHIVQDVFEAWLAYRVLAAITSTRQGVAAVADKSARDDPWTAAGNLMRSAGLTERQALGVDNLRRSLIRGKPVTPTGMVPKNPGPAVAPVSAMRAERTADAQAERALMDRAQASAGTEAYAAVSDAKVFAWHYFNAYGMIRDATKPGMVSMQRWETDPTNPCPECADLDGTMVSIDEQFPFGPPPLHPNCACDIDLTQVPESEAHA